MRKVTWPTTSDTVHGTLAVIVTVAIMLVFLTFADFAVGFLVNALLTRGATS
jgi:preprotein translocase SecE subunit